MKKYNVMFYLILIYNILIQVGKWIIAIYDCETDLYYYLGRVISTIMSVVTIIVIYKLIKYIKEKSIK